MTAQAQDQTETLPGTVFTPRQVRLLKIAVIVMGIMLVGGFAAVLGTIVYQASQLGESASAPVDAVQPVTVGAAITLKPGQSIAHIALDGNRLAVHVTGPEGGEIQIIDLTSGSLAGRVRLGPE